MLKKEKKEYVFTRLNELLKPQGYKLNKTGLDPRYNLIEKDRYVSFFFNFRDLGDIGFSNIGVGLVVVEDIIDKVVLDRGFVDYKKYFPNTVIDQSIVVPKPRPFWIETIEDLEYFTNCIVDYLENSGKEFIEKYSYLPNILKRMDELQAEGKYWQDKEYGILSGSLDAEYRGLIISKLCNDPKFRDKLELCDEVFRDEIYSNWLPGYGKLKEILQTVEPIYNV